MEESLSTKSHKAEAPKTSGFAVVVVSTGVAVGTRQDTAGEMLKKMIETAGHQVLELTVVPDDGDKLRSTIMALAARPDIQIIVTTGGTGLTASDVTFETLNRLFSKELTGFAVLFQQLSYAEAGSSAMLSRATAGLIGRLAAVFALPGSPAACRLAMERLVLPEAGHIAKHLGDR